MSKRPKLPATRRPLTPGEQLLDEVVAAFLEERPVFSPGDRVRWRSLMQNRAPAGPFVVVQAAGIPRLPDVPFDRPTFQEPLDLVVGYLAPPRNEKGEVVAGDPTLLLMYVDARRFELDA